MEQNNEEDNASNECNPDIKIKVINSEIINTMNKNITIINESNDVTINTPQEVIVTMDKEVGIKDIDEITTEPEKSKVMIHQDITFKAAEMSASVMIPKDKINIEFEETILRKTKVETTIPTEISTSIDKNKTTTKPKESVVIEAEDVTIKPEETLVTIAEDTPKETIVSKAKDDTTKKKETIVMMAHEIHNKRSGTKFSEVITYNIETQRDADGGGKKVYYDEQTEAPLEYRSGNRNDFVRKVCIITFIMLAVTAGFMIFVLMDEDLVEFFQFNRLILLIPAVIVAVSINYAMFCSMCTRKPPCNIICLVINTFAYCIITAVISVNYKTEILFYAFLTTSVLVFVCIILAMSSFDFTSWLLYVIGLIVVVSMIALCLMLIQLVTETRWKPVQIGILLVMTLLQTVMLIIELQMILGGRQVELGEDDYALGAFMLYNSIVELFLKIVQILGLIDS